MAWVTVGCPACRGVLEIDHSLVGREVECGVCGRAFVATGESPSSAEEPTVTPTTPIDDRDRRIERQLRRMNAEMQTAVTSMAWGMASLMIGAFGILLLPVSFCCTFGILGVVTATIGLICGVVGVWHNSAGRMAAIAGLTLNAFTGIVCVCIYFKLVVLK